MKTVLIQHLKVQKVKFRMILILNVKMKKLETDIDFTCATRKLPTELVDIDCCRFFRFVKLGVLAKQLLIDKCSVCSKCMTGILYAQCPDCGFISKVYLGKTHRKGKYCQQPGSF